MKILMAFDFDGVICDGRREYFRSSLQAHQQAFGPVAHGEVEALEEPFSALRPLIETGWEMPVLLEALCQNVDREQLWGNWSKVREQLLEQAGITSGALAQIFDTVRDRWITEDVSGWLAYHDFYPGMIESLKALAENPQLEIYVITTKEGRFAQQLLQQQGVHLAPSHIFGKEVHQPKSQTLQQLLVQFPALEAAHFIEDRLQTLETILPLPALESIQLYLADWGYNTLPERQQAQANPRIRLIALSEVQHLAAGTGT